jgi:ERCC4-related helicase
LLGCLTRPNGWARQRVASMAAVISVSPPQKSLQTTAVVSFCNWLKSCKEKASKNCLKKIIANKTIVKSGKNAFLPRVIFGWHRRC